MQKRRKMTKYLFKAELYKNRRVRWDKSAFKMFVCRIFVQRFLRKMYGIHAYYFLKFTAATVVRARASRAGALEL